MEIIRRKQENWREYKIQDIRKSYDSEAQQKRRRNRTGSERKGPSSNEMTGSSRMFKNVL